MAFSDQLAFHRDKKLSLLFGLLSKIFKNKGIELDFELSTALCRLLQYNILWTYCSMCLFKISFINYGNGLTF